MEGRSWFFRKQLVIFDRLLETIERCKIGLLMSPFWVKVGPCPPKCDRKDLTYAIGSTFEDVLRSEVKEDFCRIRVNLTNTMGSDFGEGDFDWETNTVGRDFGEGDADKY